MAGRTKGIPNRPGSKKPGPKPQYTKDRYTPDQIRSLKETILELLEAELALNVTDAARQLNVNPARVYGWFKADPVWKALIAATDDVKADSLEKKLTESKNVIAFMFLLKKIRPEYRENYHIDVTADPMRKLLEELKNAGTPVVPLPTPLPVPAPSLQLPLPEKENVL